jgi:hypothetical protein
VATIFQDWLKARGGDGSIEVKQALEKIEYLFTTNEFSDRIYDLRSNNSQPVRNLLAYKKVGADGMTEEFWVPPSVFNKEFCDGVNQNELVKELQRIGWLLLPRSDGKPKHRRTVYGQESYFYVFRIWKNMGVDGGRGGRIAQNSYYETITDINICLPHTNVLGVEGVDFGDHSTPSTPSKKQGVGKNGEKGWLGGKVSDDSTPSTPSTPKKTHIPNTTSKIEQKALEVSPLEQSFENSRLIGDIGYDD